MCVRLTPEVLNRTSCQRIILDINLVDNDICFSHSISQQRPASSAGERLTWVLPPPSYRSAYDHTPRAQLSRGYQYNII